MSMGRSVGFVLNSTFTDLCTEQRIQSPKKHKKEKVEIVIPVEDLSPLAHPLAQRKLVKKLHKTVKKGTRLSANFPSVVLFIWVASFSFQSAAGEAGC
jgi:hypothetical protein